MVLKQDSAPATRSGRHSPDLGRLRPGARSCIATIFAVSNRGVGKMTNRLNRSALLLSLMAPVFLSACADSGGVSGVSQAQYDSVVAENQRLQAHVKRLQSAVKYTVNSDLLFPSGGYELTEAGKETIAKV